MLCQVFQVLLLSKWSKWTCCHFHVVDHGKKEMKDKPFPINEVKRKLHTLQILSTLHWPDACSCKQMWSLVGQSCGWVETRGVHFQDYRRRSEEPEGVLPVQNEAQRHLPRWLQLEREKRLLHRRRYDSSVSERGFGLSSGKENMHQTQLNRQRRLQSGLAIGKRN